MIGKKIKNEAFSLFFKNLNHRASPFSIKLIFIYSTLLLKNPFKFEKKKK